MLAARHAVDVSLYSKEQTKNNNNKSEQNNKIIACTVVIGLLAFSYFFSIDIVHVYCKNINIESFSS